MLQINIQPLPAQTFRVILDRQECTISLYQRAGRLFIDLAVGDTQVCQGAICQNGADVVQNATLNFVGRLRWLDTRGDSPPQWEGIGERYFLLYLTPEEVAKSA